MAKLITICPKCKATNVVTNTTYIRLDGGANVVCSKCHLRFWAVLNPEDIESLFKGDSVFLSELKGDYLLESEY